MSNEQLAVLLSSYKRQLEQAREMVSERLPEEAFTRHPNVFWMLPDQPREIISCSTLYPIDDLISKIEEDIDRLTKKEENA